MSVSRNLFLLVLMSASAVLAPTFAWSDPLPLQKIKLPPGFKIEVLVPGAAGARSLARGPEGTLFISTRSEGKVYAYQGGKLTTIARGLNSPNGIDVHDGALFIAEIDRISRIDHIESDLARLGKSGKRVTITDDLPKLPHHGWRYLKFGPDGALYVSIGAPCNICQVKDPLGTILRMKPDGSDRAVYARGIRNSEGFDWDPVSHDLWFTDNGRDWLGNEHPPDELNHAASAGLNFGFPYCHGGDELDDEFGKGHRCDEFVAPAQKIPAHDASLGMRFYTGTSFPKEYRGGIFIAEHGSWNREPPRGYRISRVTLGPDGKSRGYEVFAEGWLQGTEAWGRPVDVLVMPDGALLVSDDFAGVVYRISFVGVGAGTGAAAGK